jgi:hypothetical protein
MPTRAGRHAADRRPWPGGGVRVRRTDRSGVDPARGDHPTTAGAGPAGADPVGF